jgi:hypothetical protein
MVNCKNCNKHASYGLVWKKPLYCVNHKLDGMFDVLHKRCLHEDCNKQPAYGNHLTGKIHCSKHADKKIEWKVKTCTLKKCRSIVIYSKNGLYPYEYCDNHYPDEYKSNLTSICKKCGISDMVCDQEGLCLLSCTIKHKERMKYSENAMRDFLIKNKLKFDTADIKISDGCSNRRPDFVYKTPYGVIIIENDENQHKSRLCECEQTRMIQIHQDIGEHLHFIRFNPDRYKSDEQMLCLETRHLKLKEILRCIFNNPEDFFTRNQNLTSRYMFYDNSDSDVIFDINY